MCRSPGTRHARDTELKNTLAGAPGRLQAPRSQNWHYLSACRGDEAMAAEKGGVSGGGAGALPDWVVGVRRTLPELQDGLFLYLGDARRKLSRFWILLALAAIIATAGVLASSTATVIGAMIVAPLGTPIMGVALAVVIGDARR